MQVHIYARGVVGRPGVGLLGPGRRLLRLRRADRRVCGAAYKSVRLCVSAYMSLVVEEERRAATGRGG